MGDEAINNARVAINARKDIYAILFETEEKKEDFFKKVFNIFLEKNQNKDYAFDFRDESTMINFKKSIINGHFKWMSDRTINQNKTRFNDNYTMYASRMIKSITTKPYCDFYIELNNIVEEMNTLRPMAKKILKEQCKILLDKYRCI